jgi:hypothetical protein
LEDNYEYINENNSIRKDLNKKIINENERNASIEMGYKI